MTKKEKAVQDAELCVNGQCSCQDVKQCKFVRCKNCDWPIVSGKTIVDHSYDEYETCPNCGGPAPNNPFNTRRVYGALDWNE